MVQKQLFLKTRSAVMKDGTSVAGTVAPGRNESFSFYRSRMRLRETHKHLRAGLIVWEDVPKPVQELLKKYYGYDVNGVQL